MPPPSPPRAASAADASGRHRRPHPPSRTVLLTVLAVLVLLLGSGTAISLTAAAPASSDAPAGGDGSDSVAFGAACKPNQECSGAACKPNQECSGAASATESPSPDPEKDLEPDLEPVPEPADGETDGDEPDLPAGDDQRDEITQLEDEVTALTNQERAEGGCGEVSTDERLRTAARGHSQDMAANDYFDHTGLDGRSPFDRMADAGYPDPAAENIAAGHRTPAEVTRGWMESQGHRENILNCSFQTIGVGLAYDGNGRPYWTQNFGR